MHPYIKSTAIAMTICLAAPLATQASENMGEDAADWADWQEMRGEAVHASSILGAQVSNGLNPIGEVKKLVLDQDNQSVEYVIYHASFPYALYGGNDGFASFDNVNLTNSIAVTEMQVQIAPDDAMGKEVLKLSAADVDDRLVSRLIGESMRFENGKLRDVANLLIDPETGEITHFVVQTDQDAIFSGERRTVNDNEVTVTEQGQLKADLSLAQVDDMQDFNPDFLYSAM